MIVAVGVAGRTVRGVNDREVADKAAAGWRRALSAV